MNVNDCLKLVALIGLHILAVFYDGQWLYVTVAVDCAALGYTFASPKILANNDVPAA